jgi:hypothetical protein
LGFPKINYQRVWADGVKKFEKAIRTEVSSTAEVFTERHACHAERHSAKPNRDITSWVVLVHTREYEMNAFRVAVVIVAPLIFSGCVHKPKTEYEKEIEALPMPATEAERVEQCRGVQDLARSAFVDDALHHAQRTDPGPGFPIYDESVFPALMRRHHSMNCPSFDFLKW